MKPFIRGSYEPDPFPSTRADGWQNPVTGIGTWNRDKATHLEFQRPFEILSLNYEKLATLFHYDPLSRRIVETWPKHMFRRGWDLKIPKAAPSAPASMATAATRLSLPRRLHEAALWGALYGGAIAIMQINDGQKPDQPVNEKAIQSIDCVNVQDRRYVQPVSWYADLQKPNFGEPAVYRVFSTIAGALDYRSGTATTAPTFEVHESRVIRFDGDTTDVYERQRLGGWSHSVLQAPYEEIKRFMQVFQSAAHLLTDASQGVYKLKGLMSQLASKQGRQLLDARMAMMDMARSVARSLLLDADGEEFSRIQTSFTQVPDLLDRFMQMLSMVTGIPVTILMGRSAAGMNATGDSDFRAFYDEAASRQTNELEPKLRRAYRLLMLSKSGPTKGVEYDFTFKFRPLWVPTDLERAQTNNYQATADASTVTAQIATPEEIANSRFSPDGFSLDTVVDVEARAEATAAGESFDPYPADPEEPKSGEANDPTPSA